MLFLTMQGWEKFIGPYHDSPDPEEEFRGHLLEAGFLDPQVELINRHITFPNIFVLASKCHQHLKQGNDTWVSVFCKK